MLYDGLHMPLEDDSFDNVYSVACIQHIEKHHAFLLMKELVRILKPGGHCTLHFVSIHQLHQARRSFEEECWNHVNGVDSHWMHYYYSYDELFVLFTQALGVTDLDIKFFRGPFWLLCSKGTSLRFVSDDVEKGSFVNRAPESLRVRRSLGQP